MAASPGQNGKPVQQCETPKHWRALRRQLSKEVHFGCFLQYIFFRQWMRLRDYANSKGVRIIGDIPIYAVCRQHRHGQQKAVQT